MSDPTALPNFPPPPDEHPLRGRVIDALQDLGLNPDIDADGDVEFTHDGQRMFVRCADGDWPLMRVFGQWQIQAPAPEDLLARLQRCNDMTLQLNVIKVGVVGESLFVSAEHIVSPSTDLNQLLVLTVNLVLQAVGMWFSSWLPPEQQGEAAGEPA